MEKIVKLDRSLLEITGPDAQKLLHDTLTCNLSKPLDGKASWFALLAPQGKILVEGLISQSESGFLLDIPTSELENFSKRMRLYKMRADVTISPRDDLKAGWSPQNTEGAIEDRRPNMGFRVYSPTSDNWSGDLANYHDIRIGSSIMEMGVDFDTNELFPHDIGMDQLEGVDFKKGCYIGQEVVSRMQHRGTARKRPVSIASNDIKPDSIVEFEAKSVGTITSSGRSNAIALVRLDKVKDPEGCAVGDKSVQLAIPEWASYAF